MAGNIARDLIVSREELLDFIRPRHHGILVTTRRDGRPQVSPVTMGVDSEDRVAVSSYPERAKSKNAARNEDASVCVLSNEFNAEWVQLDGRIEVVRQPEAIEALVEYYHAPSVGNTLIGTNTDKPWPVRKRCCFARRSTAGARSAGAAFQLVWFPRTERGCGWICSWTATLDCGRPQKSPQKRPQLEFLEIFVPGPCQPGRRGRGVRRIGALP